MHSLKNKKNVTTGHDDDDGVFAYYVASEIICRRGLILVFRSASIRTRNILGIRNPVTASDADR